MSAKKPKSENAIALSARSRGWITKAEYQSICIGVSFIIGRKFWDGSDDTWGWTVRPLRKETST